MPWNQPGGSDGKDPWGGRSNPNGPPDLDEIVRNLQKRFGGLFGGGRGGGDRPARGSGGGTFGKFGLGVVAGLLLIAWAATGIYIVREGESAVILRFGAYVDTTSPGLHWHLPVPIETREIVNTQKVNTVEVGYRTTRNDARQSVPRESLMLTEDENIIDIAFAVQYRIKNPTDFLFNISDDMDTLVRSATEAAVRETVGKTSLDLVLTSGRAEVVVTTKDLLQQMLDRYQSGIDIVTVEMQHALPPTEVKAAFDDAVKAREDEVRLKNEAEAYANDIIPKARGRAARVQEEAEAYRQSVIARAKGESDRFVKIAEAYALAPEVTRERLYIESIEQVLQGSNLVVIDQSGGNNLMYLPLDRILNRIEPAPAMVDRGAADAGMEEVRKQIDDFRDRSSRSRR